MDSSLLKMLVEVGLYVWLLGVFYFGMLVLGLWGFFQALTGKGRWAKETNRALGVVKVCIAVSSLGLSALTVAFALLWAGLEWRLRKQSI